ncbi:hypothetical protein [Mycolicibacterium sphagni]|nr:hypothetical protein [Mycolicibacterium sphagni]
MNTLLWILASLGVWLAASVVFGLGWIAGIVVAGSKLRAEAEGEREP